MHADTGADGPLLVKQTSHALPAALAVSAEQYRDALDDTSFCFTFYVYARVSDGIATVQRFAQSVPVFLAPPELVVDVPSEVSGESAEFRVAFTNPLGYALGAATLTLAAPFGLELSVTSGQGQLVDAAATVSFLVAAVRAPQLAGRRVLISMELDTQVLADVSGEATLAFR